MVGVDGGEGEESEEYGKEVSTARTIQYDVPSEPTERVFPQPTTEMT